MENKMGIQQYVKCVYKCVRAGNIMDVGKVLFIGKYSVKLIFCSLKFKFIKFALQNSPYGCIWPIKSTEIKVRDL